MPRVSDLASATTFDSDDEFYVVQDGNSRKVAGSVVRGPVFLTGVSTSGSFFDYFSIPEWVTEIKILFNQVSLSGTDDVIIQIGTTSGFEATGYVSGGSIIAGTGVTTASSTVGFRVGLSLASRAASGFATIHRYQAGSTLWHYSGTFYGNGTTMSVNAGIKNLSGSLDRIRIIRTGGDTFDGGALNVSYR